ncbi:MAG TPA: hypothetical protein VGT78_03910 [Rhizomicrobium sp.]|nr:hypothetical protein [Rhizomicrobium sp.]
MTFAIRAVAGAAIAAAITTQAMGAGAPLPAYKIVKTVKLGAPDKWDFLTFDPASKLVYVSHRTKVDVVDPSLGKVVGEISPIGESHGVAALLGHIYAGDAKANVLIAADAKTFSKSGSAPVGIDSDAVVADPAAARVYVMNGDGHSVTAVDAAKNKALKTVALGGSPEFAAIDRKGRLFINIADTNEIVVFDTNKLSIATRWPTAPCEKPHGMVMDIATNRLFVSCGNARMIVVDAQSGKIVANLPIGRGTDAAAFDPVRKLAFSSNGEGTLSVIAERGANDFVPLSDIKTAPGARTMALDPKTGRIFLVTADVVKTEPPEKPGHGPHFVFAPGSVKLLVLDPK